MKTGRIFPGGFYLIWRFFLNLERVVVWLVIGEAFRLCQICTSFTSEYGFELLKNLFPNFTEASTVFYLHAKLKKCRRVLDLFLQRRTNGVCLWSARRRILRRLSTSCALLRSWWLYVNMACPLALSTAGRGYEGHRGASYVWARRKALSSSSKKV